MYVNSKYIIGFLVVTLLSGGLYFYMKSKEERELKEHLITEYTRALEVAQKSDHGGVINMASALNKYKADKGFYPKDLNELYPEYIPLKAFIDKIKWEYKPSKNDFYLSKNFGIGQSLRIVSITSQMKIKFEKQGTAAEKAIASAQAGKPAAEAKKVEPVKRPENLAESIKAQQAGPVATAVPVQDKTEGEIRVASFEPEPVKTGLPEEQEKKITVKPTSIETKELTPEEKPINKLSSTLFVWKNEDSSLGFSNVQYPENRDIQILVNGKWRSYKN